MGTPRPVRGVVALALVAASCLATASAQNLPGTLSFSVGGAFANGSADGSNSVMLTDNNLTNGYQSGFDLHDAPAALNGTGPAGSAAFQWGKAAGSSSYPHTSALWFNPSAVTNAVAEQTFTLGYLYYRNGTIDSGSGASGVDLGLTLTFANPSGLTPLSANYHLGLENTPNGNDPVASADIVSLGNLSAPIQFTDAAGNRYYLELTFRVDQDTIDGTLSSQDQFRVFEGGQGRAELLGRFTTTPAIPEPSAALLGGLGALLLFRRKRAA